MAALTLTQADTICTVTLTECAKHGFAPMCVVVLDAGGHALALKRDEHAAISRPEIATAKAAGCLGLGFGGRELERRAAALPGLFAALAAGFPRGMVALPGGALIRDASGAVIGAAGISGDTSDNDEVCVLAGIEAAGLTADNGD